jgi:Ca2+/H+ antiporter
MRKCMSRRLFKVIILIITVIMYGICAKGLYNLINTVIIKNNIRVNEYMEE